MASSMLPTEQLWKLDQSNDCLFNVSEEYDGIKYAAYRTAMEIDRSNDCLFNVLEEYDGIKYAAYRAAMEIRPIK